MEQQYKYEGKQKSGSLNSSLNSNLSGASTVECILDGAIAVAILTLAYLGVSYNDTQAESDRHNAAKFEKAYLACLNGMPVEQNSSEVLVCRGAETIKKIDLICPVKGKC